MEVKFLCQNGEFYTFEIDKGDENTLRAVLREHYLTTLLEKYSYQELFLIYNQTSIENIRELEKIVWERDLPDYKLIYIKEITSLETTCIGCRDGILNQLGHMDYGGCLYSPES